MNDAENSLNVTISVDLEAKTIDDFDGNVIKF